MHRNRWVAATATIAVLVAAAFFSLRSNPQPRPIPEGPNFLIIISDDQRYDSMEYMPQTRELIFDQGVEFSKGYITTPRCCPSRSSILTGMYAHNHGVYTNDLLLTKPTFVERLHDEGYFTGIVGKYLNTYPDKLTDPPRPEFDEWNVFVDGVNKAKYENVKINSNGQVQELEGYQTYTLKDRALDFIAKADQQDRPFMLMFTPYAPHLPAVAAPGDENLYADLPPYRPPSFDEEDMSDKPEWMAERPRLTDEEIAELDTNRLKSLRALHALDQSVADIIQELDQRDMLDNTVIFYISDNGIMFGEYRLRSAKIFPYEPSTHVPFAIRYPGLGTEPFVADQLVSNIDIAPTIYDLAQIPIPDNMDGSSLVPILQGETNADWRDSLLIEGWPISVSRVGDAPFFQAIHTGRYVYIETEGHKAEFYDLEIDPYQIDNQIENPDYADIVADLKAKLEEERKTIPPVDVDLLTNETGD